MLLDIKHSGVCIFDRLRSSIKMRMYTKSKQTNTIASINIHMLDAYLRYSLLSTQITWRLLNVKVRVFYLFTYGRPPLISIHSLHEWSRYTVVLVNPIDSKTQSNGFDHYLHIHALTFVQWKFYNFISFTACVWIYFDDVCTVWI